MLLHIGHRHFLNQRQCFMQAIQHPNHVAQTLRTTTYPNEAATIAADCSSAWWHNSENRSSRSTLNNQLPHPQAFNFLPLCSGSCRSIVSLPGIPIDDRSFWNICPFSPVTHVTDVTNCCLVLVETEAQHVFLVYAPSIIFSDLSPYIKPALALMLQNVGSLCCYDYYPSGAWLIMPWESTCCKWPSLQETGGQETPNGDSFINDRYSQALILMEATATKFHRHAGTTTRIFSHALGRSSRQEAERPQWEHGLAFFTSTRSGKRTSKVLKHDKPSPYWSFFIEQCVRDHSFCGAAGFWSSCQQVKQFALGFLKAFWSLVHTQQESPNRSESLRIINQEEVWHMQHCSEAFSELLFIRNHNLDNIC